LNYEIKMKIGSISQKNRSEGQKSISTGSMSHHSMRLCFILPYTLQRNKYYFLFLTAVLTYMYTYINIQTCILMFNILNVLNYLHVGVDYVYLMNFNAFIVMIV